MRGDLPARAADPGAPSEMDLYRRRARPARAGEIVLHDGPPYANADSISATH
jgi:isoleucyl-tRNA synthetase